MTGFKNSSNRGGKLLVPSDISLLEREFSVGRRRLSLGETLGLRGMAPMYHLSYSKLDKHDMRRVLSRRYGIRSEAACPEKQEQDADVLEILKTRQESIRKRVISQNYMWAGVSMGTLTTWYSLRHFDYKSKLIILPFVAYGSSFLGRWTGDMLTGRWREYRRNRFLGELPAWQYFSSGN